MLNEDFREFVESLNSNNVKYLIVGGYAVAFHGHPRYTKDLDIWLKLSDENASNVMQALADFGFGDVDVTADDLGRKGMVVQLGYPPNRIDLINSPDGVEFDECYSSRVEIDVEGVTVPVIDLDNLIKNKRSTGRLQDLADVEKLGG
jgi:hypothetical protein